MNCPKCSASISPFKLWIRIRIYPYMKCDGCGTNLVRKWDLQLSIAIALSVGVFALMSRGLSPLLSFILIALIMIIDSFNCKLKEI